MTAIIISICSSVVSGMVLYFLKRFFNKREQKQAEYEKKKAEENRLILKSIDAIGKLTYADAIAIRDGKTNGEMKAAIKAYNGGTYGFYGYFKDVTCTQPFDGVIPVGTKGEVVVYAKAIMTATPFY